jgi:hypothetical protein
MLANLYQYPELQPSIVWHGLSFRSNVFWVAANPVGVLDEPLQCGSNRVATEDLIL